MKLCIKNAQQFPGGRNVLKDMAAYETADALLAAYVTGESAFHPAFLTVELDGSMFSVITDGELSEETADDCFSMLRALCDDVLAGDQLSMMAPRLTVEADICDSGMTVSWMPFDEDGDEDCGPACDAAAEDGYEGRDDEPEPEQDDLPADSRTGE